MSEVAEAVEEDLEAGYISSDESAHGVDLAERLRVKPSRDIWELGKIQLNVIPILTQIIRSALLTAQHQVWYGTSTYN